MTEGNHDAPVILVRPAAEDEIAEAFRWYEDKEAGLGSEFMRALDACLSSVQRNPTAYAIVYKRVRRALLRRFPYSVLYLFENDTVVVIACFHANRAPKHWRRRV